MKLALKKLLKNLKKVVDKKKWKCYTKQAVADEAKAKKTKNIDN